MKLFLELIRQVLTLFLKRVTLKKKIDMNVSKELKFLQNLGFKCYRLANSCQDSVPEIIRCLSRYKHAIFLIFSISNNSLTSFGEKIVPVQPSILTIEVLTRWLY